MPDDLFLHEPPAGKKGNTSSTAGSPGESGASRKQIEGQVSLSPKELSSELFSVSLLIQQSREIHQKLGHICDALVNLCGFSFASVILFNDTQNSLRIRSAHIKTLSNPEGLKARDFFESVARPGTELIRQYYDAVLQEQYEVVNTYCIPPETAYPILQASGISDPKVSSYLIRFGIVPQVLDDTRHRTIIPSTKRNGSQRTKVFLSDNLPLQIFIAFYNGTLPSDETETYGLYLPIRNSNGKILGLLSIGPRRVADTTISQETALAYHCAFEPLISHLALELENDELRNLVSTGKPEADLFRPSDFTQFLSGLSLYETTQDKLDFICNQVLKRHKPEIVFGVLFNGSLLIENTSLATNLSHLEEALTDFYDANFSIGSSIHAEFLGSLFLPEYQVSNSFLFTDEQLSSIETYSQSKFVFRKGLSREKLTGEGTLFTPIYNKGGLITGYIASVFDPRPTDAGPVAEAIEFYAQFIANDPFVIPGKAPSDQAGHQTQFASVFDLADSIFYYPTLEEKAQALARGILRISGLSSAAIVLYDKQDHIEYQHSYSALETEGAPPARPAALCKSGGVEKFTSDAIFMTPGFRFNQCYCFNAGQVLQLLSELETGNEAPAELSSSFIGEENFEKFLSDPNIGIFIPIQSGKHIFGYVGLGDPLPDTTPEALKDRLSLLTVFINKAATHLWQLRLEQETAEQSRGKASLRDLLSSLLATSEQLQTDEPVETKIEKVMHAVVELFGLTYAALAMYDNKYRIAYSSCKFHSQSVQTNLEKTLSQRFTPGRQLSEQVLHTIFSEPFSAGPCAIFKVPQLKAALRKEPLSYSKRSLSVLNDDSVGATSLSIENISGYLNGDKQTGLMLPLYGEQGRLAGTVSLGSQMFTGNIADTTEFIERIKIIAHFTDLIFRDYQLSQAEKQREEESSKLRKKNVFIQTLLELNITLAQSFSLHEKIKAVCERSVENSDFCSIGVLLLSGNDLVITDYYQATNPRGPKYQKAPEELVLQGKQRLDSEFLTHVLGEENLVSNSYCYDFRQIAGHLQASGSAENFVILNGSPAAYTTPIATEGALGHEEAFMAFYNAAQDQFAPVTVITPMFASNGDLLGFVTIGKTLTGIKKTGTEVLEEVGLMELIARILSRNLENDLLTDKLGRWDAKFRNVVENVQHGFILFDTSGKIEYVNGFIRQILGYESREMVGKLITDFVHPDYIPEADRQQHAVLKELKETDSLSHTSFSDYELLIFSNEGEAIPFLVTTSPEMTLTASGNLTGKGWFSLLVDLRNRREIERKQKEIATIRNNFFAMVVHDMKVPLSAIYGYSDMLSAINPSQVDEDYFHKIVSRIHLSAKNINTLIQEILDFSKYESGMISLDAQDHSLVFCLDLVLEQNLHELNKKKITIKREIGNSDFYFRFDFDKLVRVFGNIISNAIKFSKPNSTIDISIQREIVALSPFAKVMIKDHGEGIPPDETDLIFDAYRQATSKISPVGTGLGLSIAKHIVELHHGEIWAESQLGEGTSIYFTLPMSNAKKDVSLNAEF